MKYITSSHSAPTYPVTMLATISLLILLAWASTAVAQTPAPANKQTVMVPMRDGINLATNIYLPEGDGPWPVVLTRTPYNKNGADNSASTYNSRGYALVAQDVRGRYESEGENRPFETDIEDGYDTVEWIAAQAFSNGKIGIFGTSAPLRPTAFSTGPGLLVASSRKVILADGCEARVSARK
jgi:uncharacterized protein